MKNKQKRKKEYTPEQQERIITKEYFDRIAPGVVRFYTDQYICGNFGIFCFPYTL